VYLGVALKEHGFSHAVSESFSSQLRNGWSTPSGVHHEPQHLKSASAPEVSVSFTSRLIVTQNVGFADILVRRP
jgi:hypothetical protein